jgi:hypothetical protein
VLLIAAVLTTAGIAYSAQPPTGLPKRDAIFGGGQFPFISGGTRNVSLTAADDEGTLQYSTASIRVEITCSRVAGNVAVLGGVVRSATDASAVGLIATMYLLDNGPPEGEAVGGDTVSPLLVSDPDEDVGGLPKVCPAIDSSQATQPLTAGDIVVHDEKP